MSLLPTTFETPRLLARLPVPGDAELLFAAYTHDPAVSRYMVWRPHKSLAETSQFITECIAASQRETRFPYILAKREEPESPIGMLEARPLQHCVDIGYVLAKAQWGLGYMPEAVSHLAAIALARPSFYRVQAFCDVENKPSQRTLEKAGFKLEGRHERFFVHPNVSSEPRPCFMYALCR